MRSRSNDDLAGRCQRCRLLDAYCLCASIPRVANRTRVVVVRHALEAFKSTNTGRIALLALENAMLVEHGAEHASDDLPAAIGDDAALLFPDGDVPTRAPKTIVILDATWAQARRMSQRITAIHGLSRIALPPSEPLPRLRHAPRADGMSTLEAIARALAMFDGDDVAKPLVELCALHAERSLAGSGRALA